MGGASCHCLVRSEAHHTIKRDKLSFRDALPKTPTQRVGKYKLREEYAADTFMVPKTW